jgi:hypothetical protein
MHISTFDVVSRYIIMFSLFCEAGDRPRKGKFSGCMKCASEQFKEYSNTRPQNRSGIVAKHRPAALFAVGNPLRMIRFYCVTAYLLIPEPFLLLFLCSENGFCSILILKSRGFIPYITDAFYEADNFIPAVFSTQTNGHPPWHEADPPRV